MHPQHENELIAEIIAEFAEVFAFARTRWARYAEEVHSELRGVGMMVLQVILRKGPITATALGQMLDMDKAVVSRQVAKLRELELVEATPSEEDRRVILLAGSARAHTLLEELQHRNAWEYGQRFEGWNDAELESLRSALHRFNGAGSEIVDSPARRCTPGQHSEE